MCSNYGALGRWRQAAWAVLAFGALVLFGAASARAHCEIPCGIYGDALRFAQLEEDIVTIEKSMRQITALSKDPRANINQLVRWVDNKEAHADHVRHVMVQYFLTQRVKPAKPADAVAYRRYLGMLEHLHAVIVHAMRAKQTTDPAHVSAMRTHLQRFRDLYLGEDGKRHLEREHRRQEGGERAPAPR